MTGRRPRHLQHDGVAGQLPRVRHHHHVPRHQRGGGDSLPAEHSSCGDCSRAASVCSHLTSPASLVTAWLLEMVLRRLRWFRLVWYSAVPSDTTEVREIARA